MEEEKQIPEQTEPAKTKEKRKITEKQIKLLVFIVIIIAMASILLWGMVPEEIYEVSQITDNPAAYLDKEIQIKGMVKDWNVTDEFTLADSNDQALTIRANHTAAFPDGFGNDETVVVKGLFTQVNGTYVIQSYSMQIGCPSKY
ncbi:MAG: cytochrome c maturation protein CcmE [Thermoplasmata archaeon]|nr:cytochrome c maturation protein CcmE [Thermoplasmata archaeon]